MDELVIAQVLRYAREFQQLYEEERAQHRRAEDALARLHESYTTTVRALATALELRDDQTGSHAERVTVLALRLAHRAAPELAANPELEYGFLLHDIGKIGIPDAILLKPGPLDPRELAEMRRHPEHGRRILERVPYLGGLALDVVVAHHERWDGTGYPRGLSGPGIPLAARIFSLADAFDAMTNDRPYRAALSAEDALQRILAGAGSQFDPKLAREFVSLVSDTRETT